MHSARKPQLLDVIAVTGCSADPHVVVGDVGTVVELLPPDGLEVEFLDREGKTLRIATLRSDEVLVLNRERTKVA